MKKTWKIITEVEKLCEMRKLSRRKIVNMSMCPVLGVLITLAHFHWMPSFFESLGPIYAVIIITFEGLILLSIINAWIFNWIFN